MPFDHITESQHHLMKQTPSTFFEFYDTPLSSNHHHYSSQPTAVPEHLQGISNSQEINNQHTSNSVFNFGSSHLDGRLFGQSSSNTLNTVRPSFRFDSSYPLPTPNHGLNGNHDSVHHQHHDGCQLYEVRNIIREIREIAVMVSDDYTTELEKMHHIFNLEYEKNVRLQKAEERKMKGRKLVKKEGNHITAKLCRIKKNKKDECTREFGKKTFNYLKKLLPIVLSHPMLSKYNLDFNVRENPSQAAENTVSEDTNAGNLLSVSDIDSNPEENEDTLTHGADGVTNSSGDGQECISEGDDISSGFRHVYPMNPSDETNHYDSIQDEMGDGRNIDEKTSGTEITDIINGGNEEEIHPSGATGELVCQIENIDENMITDAEMEPTFKHSGKINFQSNDDILPATFHGQTEATLSEANDFPLCSFPPEVTMTPTNQNLDAVKVPHLDDAPRMPVNNLFSRNVTDEYNEAV